MTVKAERSEGCEATSQGMPVASRSWEKHDTDSPLEPPEGMQPCCHLGFRPLQASDLQDCKKINVCCFKTLDLW